MPARSPKHHGKKKLRKKLESWSVCKLCWERTNKQTAILKIPFSSNKFWLKANVIEHIKNKGGSWRGVGKGQILPEGGDWERHAPPPLKKIYGGGKAFLKGARPPWMGQAHPPELTQCCNNYLIKSIQNFQFCEKKPHKIWHALGTLLQLKNP